MAPDTEQYRYNTERQQNHFIKSILLKRVLLFCLFAEPDKAGMSAPQIIVLMMTMQTMKTTRCTIRPKIGLSVRRYETMITLKFSQTEKHFEQNLSNDFTTLPAWKCGNIVRQFLGLYEFEHV